MFSNILVHVLYLMSYFTSLLTSAEGVLAQAIHIPADVSLLHEQEEERREEPHL